MYDIPNIMYIIFNISSTKKKNSILRFYSNNSKLQKMHKVEHITL